jgi:hypothetical protein
MPNAINISLDERLSRFIRRKNQIYSDTNKAKPSAFMPGRDNKLSVFHTESMSYNQIWHLADHNLVSEIRITKRADIKVRSVKDVNLDIDPDYNPEHHVNIIGWPNEKHEQKVIAIKLAENADLSGIVKT